MSNLNKLADRALTTATQKGFHSDKVYDFLWENEASAEVINDYIRTKSIARIGLIHTEVTEMMQLVKRHGVKPNDIEWAKEYGAEGADVLIRLLDDMRHLGFDIDYHVNSKMDYNDTRPTMYNTPYEVTGESDK